MKQKAKKTVGLAITALLVCLNEMTYAQSGTLDAGFGTNGLVVNSIGSGSDRGNCITIQMDGKILVAGYTFNGTNNDFAIMRLNSNGTLDNTFDSDGIVTTVLGSGNDEINAIALQSDGKIVVAGTSNNGYGSNIAVARYNSNGSLDLSFNSIGSVQTIIGSNSVTKTLALQNDGKIVVGGFASPNPNYDYFVARFNADGSLDNSFDGDGSITTTIDNYQDYGYSLAIQADGKILLAGSNTTSSFDQFSVVRFNSDGSLDNSFDSDGKVNINLGSSYSGASALAIQADNKILLGGYSYNGTYTDFTIVRLKPNGSIDSTFDNDGIVTTEIGNFNDFIYSLIVQSDGKILAGGSKSDGSTNDFAIVRYNQNGSIDSTFNGNGILVTSVSGSNDVIRGLAIQTDGKLLAAGYSNNVSSDDFAIARYHNCVHADTTVTVNGNTITSNQNGTTYQWIDCSNNTPIIGATGQSFTPTSNGSYAVIVNVNGCYSDTSVCINITNIFVDDSEEINKISIYPNPSSSQIFIQSDILLVNAYLIIYDSFGRKVMESKDINGYNHTINIEQLTNGVYYIQLSIENNLKLTNKLLKFN